MRKIDKISKIPIKEAFPLEYKNLTPWLCDNIDLVSEAIGVELFHPHKEKSTGNFNVDIWAETADGDTVVIENQFGASNHDHLGKLITYLTAFQAKAAVWIVEIPKQEHINAIAWLNEKEMGCDFFLLKIETLTIGNSNPAPLLSVVAGPSSESKIIGKIKKEHSENDNLRKSYWNHLKNACNLADLTMFGNAAASGKDPFLGVSAGIRGLTFTFWVNQKNLRIELRIDRGKDAHVQNLKIFQELEKNKSSINHAFGSELNWADLQDYRVCSIRKDYLNAGYLTPSNEWSKQIDTVVKDMQNLMIATKPFLQNLNLKE